MYKFLIMVPRDGVKGSFSPNKKLPSIYIEDSLE